MQEFENYKNERKDNHHGDVERRNKGAKKRINNKLSEPESCDISN